MQTGLYRHFKGKFYWVLSISENRDSRLRIVSYIALNREVVDDNPIVEHRDYKEFFGKVTVAGTEVPRFTFVRSY